MPDDLAENLVRTVNEMRQQSAALTAKSEEEKTCARSSTPTSRATASCTPSTRSRRANFSSCRSGRSRRRRGRLAAKSPPPPAPPAPPARPPAARCARPGCTVKALRAAIPAGHHQLPLVIRVDQADQIAEHDAVLMAEARARQDHRGQSRILHVDRQSGRDQLGRARARAAAASQAGAQIEPGRAVGGVSRQREFAPHARIEDAHLQGAAGGACAAHASAEPRLRAPLRAASSSAISAISPRASVSLLARGSSWRPLRQSTSSCVVLAVEGLVVADLVGRDHVEILLQQLGARILLDRLGLGGEADHERPLARAPRPWPACRWCAPCASVQRLGRLLDLLLGAHAPADSRPPPRWR